VGVNAIAVKESVQELDPFWSARLQFAAAGLLLVALALASRRSFPRGRGFGGAIPRRHTACRDRRRSDGQVLGLTVDERLDA